MWCALWCDDTCGAQREKAYGGHYSRSGTWLSSLTLSALALVKNLCMSPSRLPCSVSKWGSNSLLTERFGCDVHASMSPSLLKLIYASNLHYCGHLLKESRTNKCQVCCWWVEARLSSSSTVFNMQQYVTRFHSNAGPKMIGSLINCIIISKHSPFLPAMKASERRQIWCCWGHFSPSHRRWRATGAAFLLQSHSAPYWLRQLWHPEEASPLELHPAGNNEGDGGLVGLGGGRRATRSSENGIPSENEKDLLPSVWHSVLCSCILNFRIAFDSKQLYMIVGCECLPLRWKIFSFPCRVLCMLQIHNTGTDTVACSFHLFLDWINTVYQYFCNAVQLGWIDICYITALQ